jgi:hypothetical protein
MAVITPTITHVPTVKGFTHIVVWTPLANGDTGLPYQGPGQPDRSVQVKGTFGAGGSVSIQGSNDVTAPAAGSSDWAALSDAQGVAIAVTAAKVETVAEFTNYVRPAVTAGDGTTALTVSMITRGA